MEIIKKIRDAQNIIFDFDGVIADSEEFQLAIWEELLNEHKLSKHGLLIRNIAGIADREAIENVCPGLDAKFYDELVRQKKRRNGERKNEIRLVPGVDSFITSLNGKKSLFICSSSPSPSIKEYMERNLPDIHIVLALGKGEYAESKPSPAPYLTLLEKAKIHASDCLVIEDSNAGVQSALNAGLNVIQLDRYGLSQEDVPKVSSMDVLKNWEQT